MTDTVSIIIPVFNKLRFTRQCLERLNRDLTASFNVIVIDNASSDETQAYFEAAPQFGYALTYVRNEENVGFSRANNQGARLSAASYLLFLNNDTLVTPGWLRAMLGVAQRDARVGVVGIKQLFPYTNRIHHTGMMFDADKRPQHIYPHADGTASWVNKEREYQSVTGSCLMISRSLFEDCGGFDEGYRNGYEDVDLCLQVRKRGRSVVCCTSGFIYHYGQISETRTADDDRNAARLAERWAASIEIDDVRYFRDDHREIEAASRTKQPAALSRFDSSTIYFADDLSVPSALSWVTTELALALYRRGVPVALRYADLSKSVEAARRPILERMRVSGSRAGGVQIRWSHFWPQHLGLDLNGWLNLELFVINYQFARPGAQPWDYWLQCLRQNHYRKLPLSTFNQHVLEQIGVPRAETFVLRPGYSPEVLRVDPPARRDSRTRILTVTNSHDLERYGTHLLLDAYREEFASTDDVVLVVKDYGVSSGDTTLRERIRGTNSGPAIEYVTEFTSKEKLIELYRSCDAFVSAHRGEGYGMKILDALACGLPVITPLFGGPADFCTESNCLPVDYTLVPVGDCLDTRSLRITNGPVWAEPDKASLRRRMREVAEQPSRARELGARARLDVIDRFTWDEAARQLDELVAHEITERGSHGRTVSAPLASVSPAEASPYWLGCRISVIIPTHNRSAVLEQCLQALGRQTILAHEFEVLVVDDGSTDDTAAVVARTRTEYPLRYLHQPNAGPGAARNLGVSQAAGELVLFIGDDIIAEPTLLEEHLLAHTGRSVSTAILGHIDWPPHMTPSRVMKYVCGPATLQFAYDFIPSLPRLDFRFFYTSNISLKREFLADAAADGVAFDFCFTAAAFEDSELALRLERRGLEIVYCAQARVYHDHWMDVDSFCRREHGVGRMAVVFYRKHPQIDDQIQVRWIADWTDAVDRVHSDPELRTRLVEVEQRSGALLRELERTLDALANDRPTPAVTILLDRALGVIFDVERTAGKVEEWYADVSDPGRIGTAVLLIRCARRLEFVAGNGHMRFTPDLAWLELDQVATVLSRIDEIAHGLRGDAESMTAMGLDSGVRAETLDRLSATMVTLERDLTASAGPQAATVGGRTFIALLKRADLHIQHRLAARSGGRWLRQYRAVRSRITPFLSSRSSSSR